MPVEWKCRSQGTTYTGWAKQAYSHEYAKQNLFLHYCLLIIVLFIGITAINLLFPTPGYCKRVCNVDIDGFSQYVEKIFKSHSTPNDINFVKKKTRN